MGWIISSKIPRGPVNRDLLCKGGGAHLGSWPSLGWAQHLLPCVLQVLGQQSVVWNQSPATPQRPCLGTPSTCYGGPWPWMVLGMVTSRAGQGMANSRKQVCAWVSDGGDKQEGRGAMHIPIFVSSCEKQWPHCQVPTLEGTPSNKARSPHQDTTLWATGMGERGSKKPAPSYPPRSSAPFLDKLSLGMRPTLQHPFIAWRSPRWGTSGSLRAPQAPQ